MANCSEDYPFTSAFYNELGADVSLIILLSVTALMVVTMFVVYIEEIVYLVRTYKNIARRRMTLFLLGLYPAVGLMSFVALVVPRSTILADLLASCYMSICIYMFVTLMFEYFNGKEAMLTTLQDDICRLNYPPCCCCLICLPKIKLTSKALDRLELLAVQICIVRPFLLLLAAILWTDGHYITGELSGTSAYLYITLLSAISMLLSIYGLVVIFRASVPHLQPQKIPLKFASMQIMVVLVNLQSLIFSSLATRGIPACIGSRGPKVRGSNLNHILLVIESFILCWVARYVYRQPDIDTRRQEMADKQGIKGGQETESTGDNPAFKIEGSRSQL